MVPVAEKQQKIKFASVGGFIQLLGVISFFAGIAGRPVGFFTGVFAAIILLYIGIQMSKKFTCSICNNPLKKGSKICPACNANLYTHKAKLFRFLRKSQPFQFVSNHEANRDLLSGKWKK